MLKNYLLTSLRQFSRNKLFTFLNVMGLSTGIAVFILITLYVNYEFSFDRYHENKDRIYRIIKQDRDNSYMGRNQYVVTPAPLAPALKAEFPEVEFATRIGRLNSVLVSAGTYSHFEERIYAVDPDFFKIFLLDFVKGNPETVISDPNSLVISLTNAAKYFGKEDPVGKTLRFNQDSEFVVTGVFKDMPENSHFQINMAMPYLTYMKNRNQSLEQWNNNSYFTYFTLAEGTDHKEFEAKVPVLREKYADDKIDQEGGQETIYLVQPLTEAYLFTDANFDIAAGNDGTTLYIFSFVAILILLIACINYMNMATAMASGRAKEVGIRKAVGAAKASLVRQFLGESFLVTLMALLLALVWVSLFLPFYNSFLDRSLSLNLNQNPDLIWILSGITIVVALLSGAYPALAISSFKPVMVLKGRFSSGSKGVTLRNVLVIAQFAVSGTLILSTLVVRDQLNYIYKKDMGFDREQIVVVKLRDRALREKSEIIINDLKQLPSVRNATNVSSLPNNTTSSTTPDWIGKEEGEDVQIYVGMVDEYFLDVFNLELTEGRNLTAKDRMDPRGAFLINEQAVKEIGWDNPLEEFLIYNRDTVRIAGVLKDFHQHSLHLPIRPLMYYTGQKSWGGMNLAVKISEQDIDETLFKIEEVISKYSRDYPFEYHFFDEMFKQAYDQEIKTAQVINGFSILTIIIACLGLYGLALYSVRQKVKEVSIRKVLGAPLIRILVLLNRNFTGLILVAFIFSALLSYFIMNQWLNNFAFHVEIQPFKFILTLILMILIGWITVGYQTIKTANANPVDNLKEE